MAHDVAVVHAFVTYTGVSAEGEELRAIHNHLTWAIKQHAGAWKIVHEHTSAPVDSATSKVILQRSRSLRWLHAPANSILCMDDVCSVTTGERFWRGYAWGLLTQAGLL